MNKNMHKQEQTWLSTYIYYKGPLDEVLKYLVKPFIEEVSCKYMEQYFFIRYYEKDPHIRLRLKGGAAILEKHVKPYLVERTENFFTSISSASKYNAIQFNKYEPEVIRYGGQKGIAIAEKLFRVSSDIILDLVSGKEWNLRKMLGAALQLHTILMFYFFDDLKEMKHFLAFGHQNWTHFAIEVEKEGEVDEDSIGLLLGEQEKVYEKQCKSINETIGNIWGMLENESSFEDKNMEQWKKAVLEISEEFNQYQTETISNSPIRGSYTAAVEDQTLKKWAIIDSYIHMTNNRLGLLYKEDSFVYYILKESFSWPNLIMSQKTERSVKSNLE